MENVILTQLSVPQVREQFREELELFFSRASVKTESSNQQEDRWFDLTELCAYLPDKPAKPTVYAWVNQRLIPYHKGGKKLRFLKSEIDAWLKAGRQQTIAEMATSADQFLRSNKKKSGGPK